MGLWDVENERCARCGQRVAEHADPEKVWYPQRVVDWAAMELAGAHALYAELHKDRPYHDGSFTNWAEKRTRRHPYRYDEGVTIALTETDLHPGEDFLTNERAAPSAERVGARSDTRVAEG